MTDEKTEATDAEKRAHLAGLLKSCVRLAAQTALITADLAESSGRGDDAIALARDARALLTFLEQIEQGVYRGRLNENVRVAPGAIVDPRNVPTPAEAMAHARRTHMAPAPTREDYEAQGKPQVIDHGFRAASDATPDACWWCPRLRSEHAR